MLKWVTASLFKNFQCCVFFVLQIHKSWKFVSSYSMSSVFVCVCVCGRRGGGYLTLINPNIIGLVLNQSLGFVMGFILGNVYVRNKMKHFVLS